MFMYNSQHMYIFGIFPSDTDLAAGVLKLETHTQTLF